MEYIITKRQLRLIEDLENGNKLTLAVDNPDPSKDNTQSLSQAVSNANQKNTIGADMKIQTSNFTNKPMTDTQSDTETKMPNNSSSIAQIKNQIANGTASGSYVLTHESVRAKKRLEEMKRNGVIFNKKELDSFLTEL